MSKSFGVWIFIRKVLIQLSILPFPTNCNKLLICPCRVRHTELSFSNKIVFLGNHNILDTYLIRQIITELESFSLFVLK